MPSSSSKQPRARNPVVPPASVPDTMTLFEYLEQCTPPLSRKIADIACSQTQLPSELREDAVQEIYITWTTMKPDTARFKPGQVASYAHQMARHAALRLRRELGSATRLPGSAFRKKADGTTYVTPGALAAPVDWNDLENWFATDGQEGPASGLDAEFHHVAAEADEPVDEDTESEAQVAQRRLEAVAAIKGDLTERQQTIVNLLIAGSTYAEIEAALGIKKGVLQRDISAVTMLVGRLQSAGM